MIGLMLATMKTPIGPKETAGELEIRMAELVVEAMGPAPSALESR